MKLDIDEDAGAAYILLRAGSPEGPIRTIAVHSGVNIDLDANEELCGVEILDLGPDGAALDMGDYEGRHGRYRVYRRPERGLEATLKKWPERPYWLVDAFIPPIGWDIDAGFPTYREALDYAMRKAYGGGEQ